MMGDIVAWIFGIAAAVVLIAAERRRERRIEDYHRRLIREFAGEEEDPAESSHPA